MVSRKLLRSRATCCIWHELEAKVLLWQTLSRYLLFASTISVLIPRSLPESYHSYLPTAFLHCMSLTYARMKQEVRKFLQAVVAACFSISIRHSKTNKKVAYVLATTYFYQKKILYTCFLATFVKSDSKFPMISASDTIVNRDESHNCCWFFIYYQHSFIPWKW